MSEAKGPRNEIPGPGRQSPGRQGPERQSPEGQGAEHQSPEHRASEHQGSEGSGASTWRPPAEPCPSRETLAAWADGELPEASAALLSAHLPDCAICRADLAELRAFQAEALDIAARMDRDLAALRPDRSAQAAAGDAASRPASQSVGGGVSGTEAAASRKTATGSLAGPLAGLRRVLAAFQPPQPLPAGLRARGGGGAGNATGGGRPSGGTQHFSFSADDGQVIITCAVRPEEDPDRYRLSGRVHGLDPSAVQLLDENGGILGRALLDAHGAFRLSDLGSGRRRLRFDGPGLVLELDRAIEIGPVDPA